MTTPAAFSPSEQSTSAKNPVHVGHLSKLLLQSLRLGERSYLYPDEMERIPTGLSELDKKLCGGFLPGDLVIVAGRPGTGAELFAFDMATLQARVRSAPSLICSSNFPPSFLVGRILSHISKVSRCRIARCKLSEEELIEVAKAVEEIEATPLYIKCKPLASAEWMCREALSMHEKISALRLIVIELPTVFGSRIQTSLLQNARSSIGELSMEVAASLKGLAKETGATVILVAGITRNLERRDDKRPSLRDLRNGSVLVQFADQILLLYREEIYYPETQDREIAEISIAATFAPPSTVRVRFRDEQFSDLT